MENRKIDTSISFYEARITFRTKPDKYIVPVSP